MACTRVCIGFTHWTPGRIILFRNSSLPMHYLTIWLSRIQVELLQTIHNREIRSLRLSFCEEKTSGNKTRKLVYPPPQEKPKTLDLLCHTGVYHFACHSNDLKFSLITCILLHCCVLFIGVSLSECFECLHCLFYIYMYGMSVVP